MVVACIICMTGQVSMSVMSRALLAGTCFCHCFQNRTGPGGRIVKTENRDENRFFKPKEPDFLLIP